MADAAKIRFALQESQSVMAFFPDFFLEIEGRLPITVDYCDKLTQASWIPMVSLGFEVKLVDDRKTENNIQSAKKSSRLHNNYSSKWR